MSDITGIIRIIGNTESFGANGFTKRQIVVDTDEQYSQALAIDFVKDKCTILDNYNVGDQVKVSYNLRGNEFNGKFYCNIQGWRIEKTDSAPRQESAVNNYDNQPAKDKFEPATNYREEEHDDLPF